MMVQQRSRAESARCQTGRIFVCSLIGVDRPVHRPSVYFVLIGV